MCFHNFWNSHSTGVFPPDVNVHHLAQCLTNPAEKAAAKTIAETQCNGENTGVTDIVS